MDSITQKRDSKESMDLLYEMSLLLNTGLDRETLALAMSLCEQGVNPEALAQVVRELKRESRAVKQQQTTGTSSSSSSDLNI